MELTKELQEAIQKNLPEMCSGELKKFIEEANSKAIELESIKESFNILNNAHICSLKKIEELEQIDREIEALKIGQQELKQAKLDFEVLKVKQELEYEKNSNYKIFQLVDKIFSSPIIKRRIYGTETLPIKDSYGSPVVGNKSFDEEIKEE